MCPIPIKPILRFACCSLRLVGVGGTCVVLIVRVTFLGHNTAALQGADCLQHDCTEREHEVPPSRPTCHLERDRPRPYIAHALLDIVWRLQCEMDVCGHYDLLDLLRVACPDDGDIHGRVGQHLGDSQLRHRDAVLNCQVFNALHDHHVPREEIALEFGLLRRQSSLVNVVFGVQSQASRPGDHARTVFRQRIIRARAAFQAARGSPVAVPTSAAASRRTPRFVATYFHESDPRSLAPHAALSAIEQWTQYGYVGPSRTAGHHHATRRDGAQGASSSVANRSGLGEVGAFRW